MRRFAIYALSAAVAALAVWLVLRTLEPGDAPGSEEQPGRAAVGEPTGAVAPTPFGERVRPATDPAHLEPVPPDPERGALQAGIEESARAGLDGISDAVFAQPDAPETPGDDSPDEDAGAVREAPVPVIGGGGGSAPVAPFPPPGDPRELRSLADEEPVPSEGTPIEPEPERQGNLADPDVQPSIFPQGPLPAE